MNIKSVFCDIPVLYTDRLMLRKMERGDHMDMFDYAKEKSLTKYLPWEAHPDKSYTLKYLSYVQKKYRAGEFYDWSVVYGGKMIGTCGFTTLDEQNMCGEIGYVISPLFQNQGIATEAVKRVIAFGFEVLSLQRIEARYIIENTPSKKVMEKAGMTFEGIHRESMYIKGKYVSVGVYSILRSEYFGQ